MYLNAKAEMTRKNLTLEKVANSMECSISSLSDMLNEKSQITVVQAKKFKKAIGSDLPLEVLFESTPV